jgi:GH25 family lysozyme M1 (1,4-beta-N-acetylmuramidase)
MRSALFFLLAASSFGASRAQAATTGHTEPWKSPQAILVIDPYGPNEYKASLVATDPKVRAIIHQASQGTVTDPKFLQRATEARQAHLRFGAYHLGLKGDPIQQADIFIDLVRKSGATFIALDIEDIGGRNMPLSDAEIFAKRVHDQLKRYPSLYVNNRVATAIMNRYDSQSIFARMPLWIARFVKSLPNLPTNKLWADYTLWQFASELNCPQTVRDRHVEALCEPYRPYVVPGVRYDMDVNVLNGGEERLDELFGPKP